MNTLPQKMASQRAISIKKIVVAVDLSPHSEATARYAIEIARPFGASIELVHVHSATNLNKFVTAEGYVCGDLRQQAAQRLLTDLTTALQQDYPACGERFLIGEPAEEIAFAASEINADLIITASHQPSFLGRLFNLDQAPRIIHRAPCSVLVYYNKEG